MKKSPRLICLSLILPSTALAVFSTPLVQAQEARAQTAVEREFDIPAQSLNAALRTFAELTGLQLAYSSSLVNGLDSAALKGKYRPNDALLRLLSGTGLMFRFTSASTVVIEKQADSSARVLGPVRVEGAARVAVNGVNGSRDVTATEGTGSFTTGAMTIGSKAPRSIKDTPQSVSVITQQRMQDQNITDFTGAMNQATGLTVVEEGLLATFYSRGFEVNTIQVDGGPPIGTRFAGDQNFFPQIDLAQYDHVEVLRGAAGLFNGYGEPSGVVNLVRKKPLAHARVSLEAQVGSWNSYRAVLDATGPIAFKDRMRGRFVASYQDNEYFYDLASSNKTLVYGILSYDLSPSSLVSFGGSHQRQNSVPWAVGLPRYQDGADLHLPRSFCLCFPWNRWDLETDDIFSSFEQDFGPSWRLRLSAGRADQSSYRKLGYNFGTVNPVTNAGPVMTGEISENASRQWIGEATLSGEFTMLNQTQEIVAGINYMRQEGTRANYDTLVPSSGYIPYPGGPTGRPPINVFAFDPYNPLYSEPRSTLPRTRYPLQGQTQYGAYINLRFTPLDRVHVISGVRASRFEHVLHRDTLCVNTSGSCAGLAIGDAFQPVRQEYEDEDTAWPPSISLVYDITAGLSVYAGYTDIDESQGNLVDRNLAPLDPIVGSNVEAGIKWEANAGRLNGSVSFYRIKKENFGLADLEARVEEDGVVYFVDNFGGRYEGGLLPDGQLQCCFEDDRDRSMFSRGVDAEVQGEVIRGWQVSFGYSWNESEYRGHSLNVQAPAGTPLVSRQPKHLLKLSTSYRPGGPGWLGRLTMGGGVSGKSDAFQAGTACTELNPPNAAGVSTCRTSVAYQYTQKSHAVLSANLGYALTEDWELAVNLDNVTNKRYYKTMGSSTSGNWYGDPTRYAVTLRARW